MGTRLVFVPGNHVHLELLCPKTAPIMLAEMLHGEGIPADYVDLSGLKTFADYPIAPEDAAVSSRHHLPSKTLNKGCDGPAFHSGPAARPEIAT